MRHPLQVTFEEDGWNYIKAVFDAVNGNIGILLFVGILYVWVCSNREKKFLFLYPVFALFCSVYNVVFVRLFIYKVVGGVYYRFFWILQIGTLFTFIAVSILQNIDKRRKCWITCVLLVGIMLTAGKSMGERGFQVVQNRYAIPDEVLIINTVIHEDSSKEQVAVMDWSEYAGYMRMYDASLVQPYMLSALSSYPERWNEFFPEVDYVVYPIAGEFRDNIVALGGVAIAETGTNIVYRIEH